MEQYQQTLKKTRSRKKLSSQVFDEHRRAVTESSATKLEVAHNTAENTNHREALDLELQRAEQEVREVLVILKVVLPY